MATEFGKHTENLAKNNNNGNEMAGVVDTVVSCIWLAKKNEINSNSQVNASTSTTGLFYDTRIIEFITTFNCSKTISNGIRAKSTCYTLLHAMTKIRHVMFSYLTSFARMKTNANCGVDEVRERNL